MKAASHSDILEGLARSGVQVCGYLFSTVLAAILILAWVITGPFLDWAQPTRTAELKPRKQEFE
ncbi:MAG: hypothetical protein KGJ60_09015 [Verrucomicrobiota bacterium]|nr:hypothetical protein [Verrucomicrobiota bacterium]